MRLLEYQAKAFLKQYKVLVPNGQVVQSAKEKPLLALPVIAKAQIPLGGRGRAGGIQKIAHESDFAPVIQKMVDAPLLGYKVSSVLVEEFLPIQREYYLSLLIDREARLPLLLAHRQGGIEVESQQDFWRRHLPDGPTAEVITDLSGYFGDAPTLKRQLGELLPVLWEAFKADALLIEINPLVLTHQKRLVCADAKIEVDDVAAFRHSAWPVAKTETQFVLLEAGGTVASMANGAGLAMATVDAITAAGQKAANFLDVGGGTSAEGMREALATIAALPAVKAIVVNIFAGITRCDQVAQAILEARNQLPHLPPLFIRLAGTNEGEGRALLSAESIATLPSLEACVAEAAKEAGNG